MARRTIASSDDQTGLIDEGATASVDLHYVFRPQNPDSLTHGKTADAISAGKIPFRAAKTDSKFAVDHFTEQLVREILWQAHSGLLAINRYDV